MVQHSACPNTWPSYFRMISECIAVHLTTCRTLDVPEGAKKNRKGLGACLSFPKSFTGIKKGKKKKIKEKNKRQSFYGNSVYYGGYQEEISA